MKRIEIQTDNNVSIDFGLAGLGQRISAFLIDLFLMGTVSLMLVLGLMTVLGEGAFYVAVAWACFYTLLFEWLMRGQTPGKRAMRIRVVDVFGRTPSGMDLFVRWIFRVLDIWLSLGTLAVVLITTSPRSMRLGGLLANTMVIKVGGFGGVSLQDILTIDDKFSISPEYAEVHKFRESDMLTVKSVLDRYRKYGNEAHKKLLNATAEKCREVLDLETLPDNRYLFLQTLLRDYIISTRN